MKKYFSIKRMRRSSRNKQTKDTKNSALEKLKKVKSGNARPLDLIEDNNDDLYEEVEDREYLIRRQNESNFIEDDDGSGYVDYGQKEEPYFYESEEENAQNFNSMKRQKLNSKEQPVAFEKSIHKAFSHANKIQRQRVTKNMGDDELMDTILNKVDSSIKNIRGNTEHKPWIPSKKSGIPVSKFNTKATVNQSSRAAGFKGIIKNNVPFGMSEDKKSFSSFKEENRAHLVDNNASYLVGSTNRLIKNETHDNLPEDREQIFEETIEEFDEPSTFMKEDSESIEPAWKLMQNQMVINKTEDEEVKEEAPKIEFNDENDVYMYWFDAYAQEKTGQVFLLGKTYDKEKEIYVSTCVAVNGIMRNLYFLPNPPISPDADEKEDTDRLMSFSEEIDYKWNKVYNGMGYNLNVVTRGYAFDTPLNIPKQSKYFKMSYLIKAKECPFAKGLKGDTFSHVFGTNTSALELLIVKRKLMGPCWIKIAGAVPVYDKKSHCKAEFEVSSPKSIKPLTDSEIAKFDLKIPPFTIMTLSIRTILNKKTNANEIALVNMLIHKSVQIDEDIQLDKRPCIRIGAINEIPNTHVSENVINTLKKKGFEAQRFSSETVLLSYIMSRIIHYDPDILAGHNILGFGLDVLLNRLEALKIKTWSRIGRLNRGTPLKNLLGTGQLASYQNRNIVNGRIICDTYLGAKDAVKSKSYGLTQLCQDQLNITREDVDFELVPEFFKRDNSLIHFFEHNAFDAYLSAALMFKLQLLPLSRQLSNLAGSLWSQTITGARAKRNEYLLLHEFHKLKYICPDKQPFTKEQLEDNDNQDNEGPVRRKANYLGGLVLEPKRGLYDNIVLLLDFNSLYPSIIQEHNICFTTVDRDPTKDELPDVPDKTIETGLLPKLLSRLIDRRAQIKKLLKDRNLSQAKISELDIRQKALKLTANSMYGCLGYPLSRFYAKQLAMLITAKGRETLQNTVDLATNEGLEVIYGDTDSIMINTNTLDLILAKQTALTFKKKVNEKYKNLEIDLDGMYRNLLLLQKKKYAASVIKEQSNDTFNNGHPRYTTYIEAKGLDLVRREFCQISHEMSYSVLEILLSGNDRETNVEKIHEYLRKMSISLNTNMIPLQKFAIYKSINKPLNRYHDAQSQPQVQVALRMEKARGTPFIKGETVDYIICLSDDPEAASKSYAMRAYSLDEVNKSNGKLQVDIDWYLSRQILPSIVRLCDSIDDTSAGQLAECLGMDARQYVSHVETNNKETVLDSLLTTEERFYSIERIALTCKGCKTPFKFEKFTKVINGQPVLGLSCPHCNVAAPNFILQNLIINAIRKHIHEYNRGYLQCNEPNCFNKTRSISLIPHPTHGRGRACSKTGCEGFMSLVISSTTLYSNIRYYAWMFDYKMNLNNLINGGVIREDAITFLRFHQKARTEIIDIVESYLKQSSQRYVDLKRVFNLIS